jgi:uroporphyrinogen-III decarboxylase
MREIPDRVPIHCWLGLPLIEKLKSKNKSMLDLFEWWIDDPMSSIVSMQQDLGLDPMITTYSQMIGEMEVWPRMLFPRPYENDMWVERLEERAHGDGWRELQHTINTPDGDLDYSYRIEKGFGTSCHDYLLDGSAPERLMSALRHLPSPAMYDVSVLRSMVEKVGDNAWWLHHAPAPWDLAASIRGFVNLSMDIYDRPDFVHELMRFSTDWLKILYARLGEAGIHSVAMDDTWVGAGVSPTHYVRFIKPYDLECVEAAHAAGYLVSLHVCGRATFLLEDLVDTRPDALETLTSNRSSGDVDLADAKRRVGDRVCLFGGFNEHLLYESDAAGVRAEVKRCLDAAMAGGGYILRSTGQIFDAKPGLVEIMCKTARELGQYQ